MTIRISGSSNEDIVWYVISAVPAVLKRFEGRSERSDHRKALTALRNACNISCEIENGHIEIWQESCSLAYAKWDATRSRSINLGVDG